MALKTSRFFLNQNELVNRKEYSNQCDQAYFRFLRGWGGTSEEEAKQKVKHNKRLLLKLGLVTGYAEYSGISSKRPTFFMVQNFVCRNQYMQMHPSLCKLQILVPFLSVPFPYFLQ